jgi:transposase
MSRTTNGFSPEVRARAVRLVFDHEGEHRSRRAAVSSIAAKIGCTAQSLNEWVKKVEVDRGVRAGLPSDVGERLKALERENRELWQANEILRKESAYFCDGGARPPVQAMIAFIGPGLDPGSSRGAWGRADLQGAVDRPVDLPRPSRQAGRSPTSFRFRPMIQQ